MKVHIVDMDFGGISELVIDDYPLAWPHSTVSKSSADMFIPINSIPAEFTIPRFVIEGIPAGHDTPVIEQSLFREILNFVREGEEVEPLIQLAHDREMVNGVMDVVSRPRWRVSTALRATDFGTKLDAILKTGRIPRFTVESTILRTDDSGDQKVYYRFAGFEEPVLATAFVEPEAVRSSKAGVVCFHDGQLTFFPFGGINEVAAIEPTGEVLPLKVTPTRRGVLSFLLYASYCGEQSTKHHNAWRYDEPKSKEVWQACEISARVLAGTAPVDSNYIQPLCGRFRIRSSEDGFVLDGFGDNRPNGDPSMMEISVVMPRLERLRSYLAGYTPRRMERLTRLLESMAEDFDPVTADPNTAKEKLADIFLLLRETKKEHNAAPIHDYWEPAARVREYERFLNQGDLNDQP
jgi:hypothetical protein